MRPVKMGGVIRPRLGNTPHSKMPDSFRPTVAYLFRTRGLPGDRPEMRFRISRTAVTIGPLNKRRVIELRIPLGAVVIFRVFWELLGFLTGSSGPGGQKFAIRDFFKGARYGDSSH